MQLSVIIVNYNVEHFLEQCLNSVVNASKNLLVEVFVVDNNSIDQSVEMVKKKFPSVNLIENQKNTGFSVANNQAIKLAQGQYILLLNPDTVVEEDTFEKTIQFMDSHPEGGGLGVKMIDGKGKFLPESKRGLPTPAVAFYKIFGLSALFPRSKKFGQYHLGYLPKTQTHEIEILSGAFMFMRKSALDKVGLLDEAFFMYGEDIDLSYRLILGGYKNFYFPDTQIIHYKGESTKKSSINYVFVFYNAMVIFAKKHFSEKNAKTFSLLINIAIYLRAGIAILNRFIKQLILPTIDFSLSLMGLYFICIIYNHHTGIKFPAEVLHIMLPLYVIIWQSSSYLSGGYDKPLRMASFFKGLLVGTGIILMVYALLPKYYQFSRLIILLGSMSTILAVGSIRMGLSLSGLKDYQLGRKKKKRILLVGNKDEASRIIKILDQSNHGLHLSVLHPEKTNELNQFSDIVHIKKINEVIFCSKDLSAQQIMELMSRVTNKILDFKIAQPDSVYIIGSNSINTTGDLYLLDINSINKTSNRRNKRLFDLVVCMLFVIVLPIILIRSRQKLKFIQNLVLVIRAKKSWIGYHPVSDNNLPKIKPGVLPVSQHLSLNSEEATKKLNLIYAKDYKVSTDISTLIRSTSALCN